jgi:pimeloyl-ACP methyl ester carboxylesterase
MLTTTGLPCGARPAVVVTIEPMNTYRAALVIFAVLFALICSAARSAEPPPDLPAAIFTDPVDDVAHPASGRGIQFRSHGALINAQLYRPPGAGPHPTAVILHGLPGNEQNLDLAQVLRRAGWTVIAFHYTGSWGSGGQFSLRGGVDDAAALLAYLRVPTNANSWDVDPEHIVLVGHSYGGYVAARVAAESSGIMGVVLLAPWNPNMDFQAWSGLRPVDRNKAAAASFDDVDGRLAGATHLSLSKEIMRYGSTLDLTKLAAPLAIRSVLLITASHDDDDDKAGDFIAGMQRNGAAHFTTEFMETDHGFNSRRIALQASVLRWLAALPRRSSLIIEPQTFQNPRLMFCHSRRASRRLFGSREMQQVAFLPSGSERMEGVGEFGVVLQTH